MSRKTRKQLERELEEQIAYSGRLLKLATELIVTRQHYDWSLDWAKERLCHIVANGPEAPTFRKDGTSSSYRKLFKT